MPIINVILCILFIFICPEKVLTSAHKVEKLILTKKQPTLILNYQTAQFKYPVQAEKKQIQ